MSSPLNRGVPLTDYHIQVLNSFGNKYCPVRIRNSFRQHLVDSDYTNDAVEFIMSTFRITGNYHPRTARRGVVFEVFYQVFGADIAKTIGYREGTAIRWEHTREF